MKILCGFLRANDKLSYLQLLKPVDDRVSFEHVNEVSRLIGGLGTLSRRLAVAQPSSRKKSGRY